MGCYYTRQQLDTYLKLKAKIRRGLEPNNPALIEQFLAIAPLSLHEQAVFEHAPNPLSLANLRQHHLEQFQLLLDTLTDECLPAHWRSTCLDYINKPLYALAELANCPQSLRQYKVLRHELRSLSHYFELGFTQNNALELDSSLSH